MKLTRLPYMFLMLLLGLFATTAVGCPPVGDDDDSATDDDDATGDDDDDDTGDSQTVAGDVPCDWDAQGTVDVYVVNATGDLDIFVDTVSADTTFDPWAYTTYDLVDYIWDVNFSGDDEDPCSFPPTMFGCPDFTHPDAQGMIAIVVAGYAGDECNASGVGSYEITVSGDGAPANLVLTEDDIFTTF